MSIEELIELGVTEEELKSFIKFIALMRGEVDYILLTRQDVENYLHIIARASTEESMVETYQMIKGLKELL